MLNHNDSLQHIADLLHTRNTIEVEIHCKNLIYADRWTIAKTKESRLNFYVRAIWDDESEVYCSESNIASLHIETETLDQFEEILDDVASELIYCNLISVTDLKENGLRDLIPTVIVTTCEAVKRIPGKSSLL